MPKPHIHKRDTSATVIQGFMKHNSHKTKLFIIYIYIYIYAIQVHGIRNAWFQHLSARCTIPVAIEEFTHDFRKT